MAVPRVFISSTYYDLKHVRNDIGQFIETLGYEAVMHDKGKVAYTQTTTLEQSCYKELATCDIVVCIIGNKYGTQSENSLYSITMEELNSAIREQKKIYICIQKDVAIENRTYLANRDIENFQAVYADNIKIHEYISELKDTIKNNPIIEFDSVDDIINNLRAQFAGMFQYLLREEATVTEATTYYDLKATSDEIKSLINDFEQEKISLFSRFDNSIFASNWTLIIIAKKIGLKKYSFFASTIDGLNEFLISVGFQKSDVEVLDEYIEWQREKAQGLITEILRISDAGYDVLDGTLKIIRTSKEAQEIVYYHEKSDFDDIEDDGDLPF